jgi:drug/metabolite transporter (DMT)-like permease
MRPGDDATAISASAPGAGTRAESFGLLALAVLLLGTAWPAMKIGLTGATPIWFAAGRAILGVFASFLLLPWLGQLRLPARRDIGIIVSVGLFQLTFFFMLANIGLGYLPAGRSAVLAYTTALWLVPLAVLVGESVPRRRWLGVAVGLLGIVVLADPLAQDWQDSGVLAGSALLLLASLSWALAIFHARRHLWHLTPLQALPWQLLLAAVLLTLFAVLFEPEGRIAPRGGVLLSLIYLGVVAGPAAAWAATSVARALPTVVTSLGFLGVPAIGLVISTLWLGEAVTPTLVLGAVLIALGLILVITARQR